MSDIFSRINFIVRLVIDPCDAPIEVWLQTAFPALLKFLWSYFFPDWLNILTTYARPGKALAKKRGQRKGSRGKKGGRTKRLNPLSFSPDEYIGKNLPGFDDLNTRGISDGVMWLWTIFGVIERVLFFFFVIGLVLDFLFDWFSAIYQAGYCDENRRAVLRAKGGTMGNQGIFGWNAYLLPEIEKLRGPIIWNVSSGATGNYEAFCMVWGTVEMANPFGPHVECGLRVRVVSSDQGPITETRTDMALPFIPIEMKVGCMLPPNSLFVVELISDGRTIWTDRGISVGSATRDSGDAL